MSKRTERREAERAARKAAHQELRRQQSQSAQILTTSMQAAIEPLPAIGTQAVVPQQLPAAEPIAAPTPKISAAQILANHANAQLSTGPSTETGKAISSRNAIKHGLTSRTVLLPTDNVAEYDQHVHSFMTSFKPATEDELRLVQTIADSHWRINRCRTLETGIMMKGQIEFANKFADRTAAERRALIDVEAYLKYEKSIKNLQIQESRLIRLVDKCQAELAALQAQRKREELSLSRTAVPKTITPPQQPNGFVFATPETQPASFSNQPGSMAAGNTVL